MLTPISPSLNKRNGNTPSYSERRRARISGGSAGRAGFRLADGGSGRLWFRLGPGFGLGLGESGEARGQGVGKQVHDDARGTACGVLFWIELRDVKPQQILVREKNGHGLAHIGEAESARARNWGGGKIFLSDD